MNKWFNRERKEEYLKQLELENDANMTVRKTLFNGLATAECIVDLDISDFTLPILEQAFAINGWEEPKSTFDTYRAVLIQYINWCIAQAYTDSTNAARYLKSENIQKLNTRLSGERNFFKMDELCTLLDKIYFDSERYAMQKAFWSLAWLGFKKDEARNLTRFDVHETSIVTKTWSVDCVHDRLMANIRNAISAEGYETKRQFFAYEECDFVLRRSSRYQDGMTPIGSSLMDKWGQEAKTFCQQIPFSDPEIIDLSNREMTYNNIYRCGRYAAMYAWEQQNVPIVPSNCYLWNNIARLDTTNKTTKNRLYPFVSSYVGWKEKRKRYFR